METLLRAWALARDWASRNRGDPSQTGAHVPSFPLRQFEEGVGEFL